MVESLARPLAFKGEVAVGLPEVDVGHITASTLQRPGQGFHPFEILDFLALRVEGPAPILSYQRLPKFIDKVVKL